MSNRTAPGDIAGSAPPRFGALLSRLAVAGLAAGVVSGAWSMLVTERTIAPALAIEDARSAAGTAGREEMFDRTTQVFGGVVGAALAGLLVAVVLAAVFAGVRHRLPARSDFGRLVILSAIGFTVFALLPAVKMPANPPAVGNPSTVDTRTAIYGGVLAAGLVVVLLVSALVSGLSGRDVSFPVIVIAAVLAGAVVVTLVVTLLPDSPDAIPDDVPAAVVWNFRLASLGQLAVLWATLGLVGGALVERLTGRPTAA